HCTDADLHRDWNYLQASDHFYYMCTKWFSDGEVHQYFNPYGSPYDAFLNYMNVLSDFLIRVREYAAKSPVQVAAADVQDKKVVKKAAASQPKPTAKKQATPKAASNKKVSK
ncbi:MAG TPA: alpha-amylase, partial [Bacteroidales bacterium]|nr:alpha-amylase [Bacteroidales bacterium]